MDTIVSLMRKKSIKKEVKKMKTIIVIVLSMALALSAPASALAAFTSDRAIEKTASVAMTGTPGIPTGYELVVNLRNINGGTPPTNLTWTVALGTTDWKHADQYLEVTGFATYANWGIQVYTDNKNGTLPARYPAAETGDPAGLINESNPKATLPMCWRVAVQSTIRDGRFTLPTSPTNIDLLMQEKYIATGPAIGSTVILRQDLPNPTPLPIVLPPYDDYISDTLFFAPWFWMLDKNTPGKFLERTPAQQYEEYATFVGSRGVQIAPNTYFSIPERSAKYCVYLGAKFTAAAAGVTYTTNKLTVQMYHL